MSGRIDLALLVVVALALAPVTPATGGGAREGLSEDGAERVASAAAIPPDLDADGDGHVDDLEAAVGSDPMDPTSTPETLAIFETCIDDADDDGDGKADDQDSGCRPTALARKKIPRAGLDVFDSRMTLDGYDLATPIGICPVDFDGTGTTVIERGAPRRGAGRPTEPAGATPTKVDVEILAFQIAGTAILLPGSPCNPAADPLPLDVTLVEDPNRPSLGEINSRKAGKDFPADSFFDVFFRIVTDTPLGVIMGGPPGGPMGEPVRVTNVIRSIPPVEGSLNPKCYEVAGGVHKHCPKPPLDHFKCYRIEAPKFRPRKGTLGDQFGTAEVRIKKPELLCNPVSKNGLPIFDRGAHFKVYPVQRISGTFSPQDVVVQDQFGEHEVRVLEPKFLFVPTQKFPFAAPAALDHYQCYEISGPAVNQRVTLKDQFDTEKATVLRARYLCAPATKTVRGARTLVLDASKHLVCYEIKGPKFEPREVMTANQFGFEDVRVIEPELLCSVSLKKPPKPPGKPNFISFSRGTFVPLEFDIFKMPIGSTQTAGFGTAQGQEIQLTDTPGYQAEGAPSPDGTMIAFTSNEAGGNFDIWVMSSDGTNQTRLTTDPARDGTPAWSQGPGQIAFATDRTGNFEIFTMDPDGSNQTNLTNDPARDLLPYWCPGSTRIVFQSDRSGNDDIWIMNADGSNPVQLTTNPAPDRDPECSPDGTKVVFTSLRDGNPEIYLLDLTTGGPYQQYRETRLTVNPAADVEPAWCVIDGVTKVLFSTNRDQNQNLEIYSMDTDGSDPTRITNNPLQDEHVQWFDP